MSSTCCPFQEEARLCASLISVTADCMGGGGEPTPKIDTHLYNGEMPEQPWDHLTQILKDLEKNESIEQKCMSEGTEQLHCAHILLGSRCLDLKVFPPSICSSLCDFPLRTLLFLAFEQTGRLLLNRVSLGSEATANYPQS